MAAGNVVAFSIAVGLSVSAGIGGAYLCSSQFTRSRRLLETGAHLTARVVEAIPQHRAGQSFPSDAARIVVEYELGGTTYRDTIRLARTSQESYRIGDTIEIVVRFGRAPQVRTLDEPNIAYGTMEQIAGAVLVILALLPLFIMFSVHALTP